MTRDRYDLADAVEHAKAAEDLLSTAATSLMNKGPSLTVSGTVAIANVHAQLAQAITAIVTASKPDTAPRRRAAAAK